MLMRVVASLVFSSVSNKRHLFLSSFLSGPRQLKSRHKEERRKVHFSQLHFRPLQKPLCSSELLVKIYGSPSCPLIIRAVSQSTWLDLLDLPNVPAKQRDK